jgi:hypothetical protein
MKNIGIFIFIIAMLGIGIFNIISNWDILAKIPNFIANNPEYKSTILSLLFLVFVAMPITGIIAFMGFKPKKK